MSKRGQQPSPPEQEHKKPRTTMPGDAPPNGGGGGEMEIDENLHSRQLAVYGREVMRRMAGASVLISGLNGTGVEIGEFVLSRCACMLAAPGETAVLNPPVHSYTAHTSQERDPGRRARRDGARSKGGRAARPLGAVLPRRGRRRPEPRGGVQGQATGAEHGRRRHRLGRRADARVHWAVSGRGGGCAGELAAGGTARSWAALDGAIQH